MIDVGRAVSALFIPPSGKFEPILWGDGIADMSGLALMSARTWADVGTDELVYLIPGCVPASSTQRRHGLGPHVTHALLGRCFLAAQHIGERAAIACVNQTFAERGGGTRAPIDTAQLRTSGSLAAANYAFARATPAPKQALLGLGDWCGDLRGLTHVAKFAADILGETNQSPSLAEAVDFARESGINAAYAYPQFVWAHELLMTGAWLGHVQRGRPALMPTAVADCLLSCLSSRRREAPNSGQGQATCVADAEDSLARVTAQAVGYDRSLQAAAKVQSTGVPCLVRPLAHGSKKRAAVC